MKKPILILVAVGALVISCVWLFLHNPRVVFSLEPTYDGETFSYWMEHWYQEYGHRNLEAEEAVRSMGTKAVPYLVKWISQPPIYSPGLNYPERALKGFEVLGPVAKPAIPDLVKLIGQNQGYPERALLCIGIDAVPALSDKLLETLADKSEPVMNWRDPRYKKNFFHVQASIIHVFGEMGTNAEAAIPAVMKALYAKHSWGWREGNDPYSTLVSIGRNHPEIVIPALIDVLTNTTTSVFNRGAIAKAMASLDTNRTDVFLLVLISAIKDKRTDDMNRRAMAGALADVGINHPDLVVPVLIEAFTNSDVKYRDGIADALAAFGSDARPALPPLLSASQSPYFYLREKAGVAVKRIAPERPDSLSMLIKDLNNSEPGFRQQAIYALGRLGTNGVEAVPALLKCLSHPDSQTRIDATRALHDIGESSDQFIAELGENLSHTNSFTASEAYSTLGGFAGHSKLAFITLVKKGFNGSVSRDVRQQVKWILINISRDNPTFMLECLDDPDAGVRSGALAVFYELARNVPQSILKLRQLTTNDPDPYVRNLAADILRLQLQQ